MGSTVQLQREEEEEEEERERIIPEGSARTGSSDLLCCAEWSAEEERRLRCFALGKSVGQRSRRFELAMLSGNEPAIAQN
jgi:hypothetical protein